MTPFNFNTFKDINIRQPGLIEYNCLHEILPFRHQKYPDRPLRHLESDKWISYTNEQLIKLSDHASSFLIGRKCKPGDRVAILSKAGSPIWLALDRGILQIGCITVPFHEGLSHDEIQYLETDSGIQLCFIHHESLATDPIFNIETIQFYQDDEPNPEWADWPLHSNLETIKATDSNKDDQRIATIIYTSGSTGQPKGVMLTHHNIISNIKNTLQLLPLNSNHRSMSFLPVSHIFERMVIYSYLVSGIEIFFVDSPREALENIKSARPHFFTAVPRILESVYEGMMRRSEEQNYLVKKLFNWALDEGKIFGGDISKNGIYFLKLFLLNVLIFKKWRNSLGGHVKGILVGAAAMNHEISRVFSASKIKIREGYGMTETSPVISFNRFQNKDNRFGTAGLPIPNTSVEIRNKNSNGAGEIWVNGPGVMKGYWNNEKLTKEVIVDDWLFTGDVGEWVDGRFLRITDRKKNIFKTSSGKYVYPSRIENYLNQSFFVDRGMIIGFQKAYISALITPEFSRLEKWALQQDIHWTAPAYIIHNPKIINLFEAEIIKINSNLSSHEQIRKFNLLSHEWTIESGELSSTLKLRRGRILDKYAKVINETYKI